MPADLAALLMGGAYVFAGFGVLTAVRVTPGGVGGLVQLLGLAYLTGVATTLVLSIALLCAGIGVHVATFAVLSVAVGTVGLAVSVRRSGGRWREAWRSRVNGFPTRRPRAWRLHSVRDLSAERWLVVLVLSIVAVLVVLTYRWANRLPLSSWDSWSIWARKGTLLLQYGTLPAGFFTSHAYAFMHPDYPLLVPVFESIWFRLLGGPDTQSLHAQFWLLYVAALWAAAYLASRVARPAIWVPLIGLLAVTPALRGQLLTLYADVPMGLFLMIALMLLGRWTVQRAGYQLSLATLFLAAAANTKNEGLIAAACALMAAVVIMVVNPQPTGRRPALTRLAIASVAFAVAVAPWRLWLALHHISGDMPIGKGLDPSYLLGRSGRISPTLTALSAQITDQSSWYYLMPLGIAVVIAALFVRSVRRGAMFYGLTGLAVFASLLWAYTINPNPIGWYLATSASRSVDGMMFIAAAALLSLTGALLPSRTEDPTDAGHGTSHGDGIAELDAGAGGAEDRGLQSSALR